METQWYYSRDGHAVGPVSGSQLKQLVDSGQLSSDDLIWRQGMREWLPARNVGLLGAKPPREPPPLPAHARSESSSSKRPSQARRRRQTPVGWWIALVVLLMMASASAAWMAHAILFNERPSADARSDSRRFDEPRHARTPRSQDRSDRADLGAPRSDESHAEESSLRPLPSPAASSPAASSPATTLPTTSPVSTPSIKSRVLYQRVDVSQTTRMSIEGLPIEQQLQYHLESELLVEASGPDGTRRVGQRITTAVLDSADESSRAAYERTLLAMIGVKLSYGIDANGNVVDFTGPKSSRVSSPLAALGGTGFQVTSLLDDDGWKELIHLAFIQPDPQRATKGAWQRQMAHNWGPLGSWSGLTKFMTRPSPSPAIEQFDYAHEMTYTPPGAGGGELPFQVTGAAFRPIEARGVVYYDTRQERVTRVDERFHVQGALTTSLLGQPAQLDLEEVQILAVTMSDQK